MVKTCIFFCSVQHKLLDELLMRLADDGVRFKRINCTYIASSRFRRVVAVLRGVVNILKAGRLSRGDDLLVFHYLSMQACLAIPILVLLKKRIVLHFWGTDYSKFKKIKSKFLVGFFINKLNAVTFANEAALNDFKLDFPESNACKLTFGLESIDFIDEVVSEGAPLQERHLPVVVCGTNSSPNQQLLEVIDVLDAWDEKGRYKFVFPLAYGDKNHKKMIKTRLSSSLLNYEINEEFMIGRQLATFRLKASILVQVQKIDFLSGAMLEHVYAGTKVITGKWLPYDQVRECGVNWFEIDKLSELPGMIRLADKSVIDGGRNKKIVADLARWSEVIVKWKGLYQV